MDDLSSNANANNEDSEVPIAGEKGISNSADNDDNDGKKKKNRLRREREIESLHQEMEVTGFAKGKTGHRRRIVPRDVSKIRTQKRRLLEKGDAQDRVILGEEDELEYDADNLNGDDAGKKRKRLRGSKTAMGDKVIQGSVVFQNIPNDNHANIGDDGECVEKVEDGVDGDDEDEEYSDTDEIHETVINKTRSDNDAQERGEGESRKSLPNSSQKRGNYKKSTNKASGLSGKKRRKMYRLRNFQSFKMAQKHGDALAAHARGQPKLAIEILKAVALAAPSAPQVYSSLGMVYEDMLRESRKQYQEMKGKSGGTLATQNEEDKKDVGEASSNNNVDPRTMKEDSIPDRNLADQRILATKAYGSHHVAAILCKKDFTLWVRAGDSAIDIANVHHDVATLPNLSKELCEYHISERLRWQNEALRDYGVADNQKPPGIDVPAKLAMMHMELGNLSNALSILTDLKNNAGSDFQSSYKAWMLYSDLMLRLGHECIQWNNGIQRNENYMLRRWLRKFSKVFDWQERRLQALSLALEAAAGTANTKGFLTWIRNRIMDKTNRTGECRSKINGTNSHIQNESELNLERQSLEVEESKQEATLEEVEENKDGEITDNDGIKIKPSDNENDVINRIESQLEVDESKQEATLEEVEENKDGEITDSEGIKTKPLDSENDVINRIEPQLEKEKKIIISNQSRELEAFDKTTSDMTILPESEAAKAREFVRSQLLKSHDAAILTLVKEYSQKETGVSSNTEEQEERIIGMNANPLPLTGSIRQVCSIASELMKHLHGLELYEGARLVGDDVSCYMKDRARRHDAAIEVKKKADEWQQKLIDSPFFLDAYDDGNDSDNEGDSPYLSDEEILLDDDDEESPLVDSLRKGGLTPELRVLYGLALIGEGGRNFIAAKCLEAIDDLEQENRKWFAEGDSETSISSEPYWFLFRRAMTEQLSRTGAYAFLADILRKTNKEHEWALHFSPCFRRHIETLKRVGLINELLRSRDEITPNINFRKNQLLKVILAGCKFDIESIDESKERKRAFPKSPCLDRVAQLEIAQTVLSCVESIVPSVWSIENGRLPPVCVEVSV